MCIPVTLRFFGRTAHEILPEVSIDMSIEVYLKSKEILACDAGEGKYIWKAGCLQGGTGMCKRKTERRLYAAPFEVFFFV